MTDTTGFTGDTAIGTVVGVRAFNADGLGRLTGITYPNVFRPGENVATCRAKEVRSSLTAAGVRPIPGLAPPPQPDETWTHRAGAAGCSCGYWAYTDGSHSFSAAVNWSAVIEGYGLVTKGTRGFRAEKARLVALVPPVEQTPRTAITARLYGAEGVPIYATLHDALAAHPILEPPDTSGDFWEREERRPEVDDRWIFGTFTMSAHTHVVNATNRQGNPANIGPCGCPLCR